MLDDFSGKPHTAKLKVNPRAGLGRGRHVRFSPATALGTPVVPARGTLYTDRLRITDPSDGPQLSDRRASKRPLVESSSPITKAKAPAKDALVRKKTSSWSLQVTYVEKDPREIMKVLRQGTHNYIDKFDELLDEMEAQKFS